MSNELGHIHFGIINIYFELEGDNKVKMTDIVTYKPPFGLIGRIANSLFIKKQLESIFEYRRNKMDQIFNSN